MDFDFLSSRDSFTVSSVDSDEGISLVPDGFNQCSVNDPFLYSMMSRGIPIYRIGDTSICGDIVSVSWSSASSYPIELCVQFSDFDYITGATSVQSRRYNISSDICLSKEVWQACIDILRCGWSLFS